MGIFFGSNTGSADKLDDYDEGSWIPTFTVNNSDSGVGYSAREGYYTKIGSLVYCKGMITLNGLGSGSGNAGIGGLPFTIRDDMAATGQEGFGMLTYWSNTNQTSNFIFWVNNGTTIANIQRADSSNATSNADKNNFSSNSDLRFSVFYNAD